MQTCAIEGCEKPISRRSWCSTHYSRWKEHGDPTVLLRRENGQAPDSASEKREWRQRPGNRERERENQRRSIAKRKTADPEGYLAAQRARYAKHIANPENREKHRARGRARYAAGLTRRRGLTIADRHEYWVARGGLCDMCQKPCADPALPGAWKVTVVDHDHDHCKSGIGCLDCVRGQGHRECNVTEGVVRKALASGLLTAAWGPLSAYLADPPMGKWVRGRLADGPSDLAAAA